LLATPATLRTGPSLATGFLPALPRAFCWVVKLFAASVKAGDLVVGALAAVNAYGQVVDEDGSVLAGARSSGGGWLDVREVLRASPPEARPIENTSLAVVAPGIAEALFATAIGLVAAIPATIFYNKFSSEVNKQAQRLEGFADEFSAILSRQIDERA